MRKLGFLFGCMFISILLAGCCKCPCSEKIESINESEFEVNDFDSALTAFYNGGSFTCNFSGDYDGRFTDGYIAVDGDRMSAYASGENSDSHIIINVIIKNGLLFEWGEEDGVVESEVDEGGIENIIEILYNLREDAIDGTGTIFNINCKAGIKESDFVVPNGIYFDY